MHRILFFRNLTVSDMRSGNKQRSWPDFIAFFINSGCAISRINIVYFKASGTMAVTGNRILKFTLNQI